MTLRVEYRISAADPGPYSSGSSPAEISRTRNRWFVRWTAPLLLFMVGCLGLGYYAYDMVDTRIFQADQSRKFDQALRDSHDNAARELSAEAAADLKAHASHAGTQPVMPSFSRSAGISAATEQQRAAGDLPLGRIEIASIGLTAMIQEGTGARTLQRAVGHITGTAPVGWPGNVGLAAHRDTFFGKLRNIHKGDEIGVTTLTGTYHYRVELISIVEPEDSAVLRDTGENILTLVTCYPFSYVGSAPRRFIVRAKQTSPSPIRLAATH